MGVTPSSWKSLSSSSSTVETWTILPPQKEEDIDRGPPKSQGFGIVGKLDMV